MPASRWLAATGASAVATVVFFFAASLTSGIPPVEILGTSIEPLALADYSRGVDAPLPPLSNLLIAEAGRDAAANPTASPSASPSSRPSPTAPTPSPSTPIPTPTLPTPTPTLPIPPPTLPVPTPTVPVPTPTLPPLH